MRKCIVFATIIILAGMAVLAGQTFDQRVSETRRHMRAGCQAVQKVGKTADVERLAISESAAEDAAEALAGAGGDRADLKTALDKLAPIVECVYELAI